MSQLASMISGTYGWIIASPGPGFPLAAQGRCIQRPRGRRDRLPAATAAGLSPVFTGSYDVVVPPDHGRPGDLVPLVSLVLGKHTPGAHRGPALRQGLAVTQQLDQALLVDAASGNGLGELLIRR